METRYKMKKAKNEGEVALYIKLWSEIASVSWMKVPVGIGLWDTSSNVRLNWIHGSQQYEAGIQVKNISIAGLPISIEKHSSRFITTIC